MHEARGGGSEIVSYCGLSFGNFRRSEIIGPLKIARRRS